MSHPKLDVRTLSPQERLDLLSEIWDSFGPEPDAVPLTDAQRKELDRRLDELDRDSTPGIPWQEVLDRIRGQAG